MSTHNANRFDSEHDAPEESVHLLRAELDACREEIDRLRRAAITFQGAAADAEVQLRAMRATVSNLKRHIDLIGHQP